MITTKKWSDKPLYEGVKKDPQEDLGYKARPQLPWSSEVLRKGEREKRQPTESPLKNWFMQESDKRSRGLKNEIDINEIKGAIKGFKNRWTKTVKQFPESFENLLQKKDSVWDWNKILELKQQTVEK